MIVDLKSPDGPDIVLDLAERADILIEGYRPGVAERLGVGPDPCHARNPGLVYGRMTGWGQQAPLAQRAGHDIAYIALTGTLGMIGHPGPPADRPRQPPGRLRGRLPLPRRRRPRRPPPRPRHRRRPDRGRGRIVDGTSHLSRDDPRHVAAGGWQDRRAANLLDGGCPFYGTYETADGGYRRRRPRTQVLRRVRRAPRDRGPGARPQEHGALG